MEQIKFTRKKQFTTFLETTVLAKRDEIRQLESMVDNKFIDTLGYFYGIEYTQQYSYEVIFDGYEGRKAIIDNMQRSTLWDMSYHANGLMSKMDYQIKYLQFVIEYGKLFDNYGDCIKAWQEFVKNDTIPTKIDTESVENVENFNDKTCKKQVEILNAVQKDLQNYQNRQTQKMQLNEEKRTENVENVETTGELSEKDEKEVSRLMEMLREEMSENDTENVEEHLPNLGAREFLSVFESYVDMACEELSKDEIEELSKNDGEHEKIDTKEQQYLSELEYYMDMAIEELSKNDERCILT